MSPLLLDTHLLLWAAASPQRLSDEVKDRLQDPRQPLVFSVASIWEVVIKSGLERPDFRVDARRLRRGLLNAGYRELGIVSEHILGVARLPAIHKDPFDRVLVAQAETEGLTLLTSDPVVARYPGSITLV